VANRAAGKPPDDDPIIVALRADIVTRRPSDSVDLKDMRRYVNTESGHENGWIALTKHRTP
jgi:hypothetical protein